jgi:hypothetical protein
MDPITFIYTNSLDMTADLLISKIGTEAVFRFNVDLWREYKLKIDHAGLTIENSAGRQITSGDIVKFYWRKPFTSQYLYHQKKIPSELVYMEEEITYGMRDMVNLAWSEGKIVLVEPLADSRVGKFVQLKVGAKYFKIPPYKFVSGSSDFFEPGKTSIVKSLTSKRVNKDSVLYTTRVQEDQLDPSTPWLVQDYLPASWDVTVVFVRDGMYGFELNRDRFLDKTVDWRETGGPEATDAWRHHQLPKPLEDSIFRFMGDLGLHYGRLDFLFTGEEYFFLEVNPNGEWAWLDFYGEVGLLGKMIEETSPHTARYSIPVPRWIRF